MSCPPLGLTMRAKVDRVVDGDTVDVVIRLPVRIRLRDCWAEGITGEGKAEGLEASAYLESLLPEGSQVIVNVPTGDAEAMLDVMTFGRALAHLWIPEAEESISEMMVGAGFATKEKPEQ